MPIALHVSHVAKGFGGVPVLRDISFDLHSGELTVLAGENGAGKSTLMKIITGQLRADAGEVLSTAPNCTTPTLGSRAVSGWASCRKSWRPTPT